MDAWDDLLRQRREKAWRDLKSLGVSQDGTFFCFHIEVVSYKGPDGPDADYGIVLVITKNGQQYNRVQVHYDDDILDDWREFWHGSHGFDVATGHFE